MGIASRLRQFINYRNIPVTQFADTCGIPRPTLSQILSGRNKKVSDEFISKIHDGYPSLSVMWLLFGEGDMTTDANTQTSEPQIAPTFDFDEMQEPKIQEDEEDNLFNLDIREKSPEKPSSHPGPTSIDFTETPVQHVSPKEGETPSKTTISIESGSRRIVNIIVVYSDTTVQSFVPAP